MATHSLSVVFEALITTSQLNNAEADGQPSTSITQQPSLSGNVTLRARNSARIISLSGGRPVGVASGGVSLEHNDRDLTQSPFRSRRAHTAPPMLADWHSPFSVPDPLAYDTSRARTMSTDYYVRPKTTVPRIAVSKYDEADDDLPVLTGTAKERSSLDVHSPALEHWTNDTPQRRYSEDSLSTRRESEAGAGATCTMYVPYRPWYEPIKKMDSHPDIYSVQEHSDGQYQADQTPMSVATTSPSVIIEQNSEQSSPPTTTPTCSPPPPRLSQLARSKRKPPVPPRRRRQSCPTKEISDTRASLLARTGARVVQDSISGLVKLPYLDELKHVLKGDPLSQRRASTGESRLATNNNPPTPLGRSHIRSARSIEVIAKPRTHAIGLRRSRSASAPESTSPRSRLPMFPRLLELPAETIVAPVNPRHTFHENINRTDHPEHIAESLDPSLMLTRMDNICASWNSRSWSKAESYLKRHLTMVQHDPEIARKVRHLLGVCAS